MMYKKKKRNSDNFIRNVVIGFGSIFTVLILSIILINSSSEELKYNDFQEVKSYNQIESIQAQKFLLYFYSESCGACQKIKTQSLNFFDEYKNELPVYMMDASSISGSMDSLVLPPGDVLNSTPTLMVVENGVIVNFYVGTEEIGSYYNEFSK